MFVIVQSTIVKKFKAQVRQLAIKARQASPITDENNCEGDSSDSAIADSDRSGNYSQVSTEIESELENPSLEQLQFILSQLKVATEEDIDQIISDTRKARTKMMQKRLNATECGDEDMDVTSAVSNHTSISSQEKEKEASVAEMLREIKTQLADLQQNVKKLESRDVGESIINKWAKKVTEKASRDILRDEEEIIALRKDLKHFKFRN